ncbi:protease complex subunit PrcB family protein [Mesonia maritima]|uniref:PrcB C-terminal domain-containing protein n=1 Tax=Mesonia maritima TaxID=1793873 RepID=A0ABU1K1Z6_9FLAO|nr:protease complex subunit PrcB family protein [Mesonia maritima]MDR6299626.1 hypothetical protein [Mesonia maritima]
MKKLFALIVLSISLMSCNSMKNFNSDSLTEISKGVLTGAGEEGIEAQQRIITSEAEWNSLVRKMNSVNNMSKNFKTNDIDFSKEMVVAVFDKVMNTGGHSIWVSDVKTIDNEVQLMVSEKHPDGMATSVMTQPYYLAKMPKTDKKVVFKNAEM